MGKTTRSVSVYRDGDLVWFRRAVRQRQTARMSCGGMRRNPIEGKRNVEMIGRASINPLVCLISCRGMPEGWRRLFLLGCSGSSLAGGR